jgi:hypothetical protein
MALAFTCSSKRKRNEEPAGDRSTRPGHRLESLGDPQILLYPHADRRTPPADRDARDASV